MPDVIDICLKCGKEIPPGPSFCSSVCEASSEIAESRRSKMIDLLKAYENDTETLADRILAVVDQVERDTRERCAQEIKELRRQRDEYKETAYRLENTIRLLRAEQRGKE